MKAIYAAHLPAPFDLDLIHDLQTASLEIMNCSRDLLENSDYMFLRHGDLYAHRFGRATIYYRRESIFNSDLSK